MKRRRVTALFVLLLLIVAVCVGDLAYQQLVTTDIISFPTSSETTE